MNMTRITRSDISVLVEQVPGIVSEDEPPRGMSQRPSLSELDDLGNAATMEA
jgi:hypothetical protein